jgi:hypothetical protein
MRYTHASLLVRGTHTQDELSTVQRTASHPPWTSESISPFSPPTHPPVRVKLLEASVPLARPAAHTELGHDALQSQVPDGAFAHGWLPVYDDHDAA